MNQSWALKGRTQVSVADWRRRKAPHSINTEWRNLFLFTLGTELASLSANEGALPIKGRQGGIECRKDKCPFGLLQ